MDVCAAFVEHRLERLGLLQGAGEAVEDDALRSVLAIEEVSDETDDQIVGHELPAVDVFLSRSSQLAALTDGLAQHVAGRDVVEAVTLDDHFALCPFA